MFHKCQFVILYIHFENEMKNKIENVKSIFPNFHSTNDICQSELGGYFNRKISCFYLEEQSSVKLLRCGKRCTNFMS